MPCYNPLQAWRHARDGSIVFQERLSGGADRSLLLSCGQCVGCRLERSRQWAVRCVHEASLWKRNCVVTLTYSPQHLPPDGTLQYRDFQLFMKRLRKAHGSRIRFFVCGEYGETTWRAHYHACLFNFRPSDLVEHSKSKTGTPLYRSRSIDALWSYGDTLTGDLDFESAAYVARYIMKKVTGDAAAEHYRRINVQTGELLELEPEFIHMSLKPGIGAGWFDKFSGDVYPHGEVIVRGKQARPPRYYDRKFKKADPDGYDELASAREAFAAAHRSDGSPERLAVREAVSTARASQQTRSLK